MYRFVLGGVEVRCDTAKELRAALAGGSDAVEMPAPASQPESADSPFPPTKAPGRRVVPGRKKGAAKSWAMARWLAEREGGTPEEVRSRLATMKKADFTAYSKLEAEFFATLVTDKKAKG